jgi:hypothetical protein
VITKDKTAEMRPVQVAQIDGGQALIDSGLQEGEQVVVDGQYKLQPGSPVQIIIPNKPAKGNELTQANESPTPDQAGQTQPSPGENGSEHHRHHQQKAEQPENTAPPVTAKE